MERKKKNTNTKSQKKIQKKENRLKNFLIKVFTYRSKTLQLIGFSCLCLLVFLSSMSCILSSRNAEINCLRHKFSNDYCRCYANETGKYYFEYFGRKLHKVAHQNCISLFDGNVEKDSRVVSPEEMKIMQENNKKSFMNTCLHTSGRKEYCECALNEWLSFMTEEKWKIFYFGGKENASEKDKKKYHDYLVTSIENVKIGAKKCLKKFPKSKK